MSAISNDSAMLPPSGTITFLMTDVEGSTRLWEKYPEQMRGAMARHDLLIESAVAARGGGVVRPRGEGDSRFAVFNRGTDAVVAASDIQRSLFSENWATASPIRIRIAVHSGEAELREGDYYGTAVNRCARLRSAAHGGQTLLSKTTYTLTRDSLPNELGFRDLGEHRLKDLAQPEQIFQLLIPGLPSDFPPLASLESFHHNLPAALTSFIGREREITEVKNLLKETRLLTITGSGGAGKTRLALQVAADLVDKYANGVWLVELAPIVEGALLPQFVGNALGIREEPDRPIVRTLIDYLHDKQLLLVLDNCEHLIESAAQLAETLLRASSGLRILAASREPLGVAGEVDWRIPSLSRPVIQGPMALESIANCEAVRLFVDRASAVQPGFKLDEQNAQAIAEIAARLDGIPLAIELAAARVRVLSVEQIAARLDDRFRLLVGGSRTALHRHQTLRALIDWSYDLLSETERILLARLSVFVGGWTLEAAEQVCAGSGIEAADIMDLLSRLVTKSLVVAEDQDGAERYHLLETIRQYAKERLVERGEGEEYARRHAEHFARLGKESYSQMWGPRQGYWLNRLETEHDNIRQALEWAAHEPAQGDTLLRFATTLWRFWEVHGHLSEGRRWLERGISKFNEMPVHSEDPKEIWYLANALRGAGNLARQQGDYEPAIAKHQQSLQLFQKIDDKLGIARELDVLGEIARYQGDYERAIDLSQQSLTIRRAINDKEGIAASLANLGITIHDKGDYKQAKELLEQGLKLGREIGDKLYIALTLTNLGLVAHEECEYPHALELYRAALKIYEEQRDKLGLSDILQKLADVAKDQGDFKEAKNSYSDCLSLKKEVGDRRGVARAIAGLAEVALLQGQYQQARELSEQSLGMFRDLATKRGILSAASVLASTAQYQGNYDQALALASESIRLAQSIGARRSAAYNKEVIGLIEYAHRNLPAALGLFQDALDTFRAASDRRSTAFTLVNLARAAYRQGDDSAAENYLHESLDLSRHLANQSGIAFSLEIMGLVQRRQGHYDRAQELFRESLQISADEDNKQGIVNCLGALAGLAGLMGQPRRAVQLFGAAQNARESIAVVMAADDEKEFEDYLEGLRHQVDRETFRTAWAEGCEMPIDQAVKLGLGFV